jgi:hypothetical protein
MLWNVNLGSSFLNPKTFQCESRLPTFELHYKYHEVKGEEENENSDYITDSDSQSSSTSSVYPESTLTVWLKVVSKGKCFPF